MKLISKLNFKSNFLKDTSWVLFSNVYGKIILLISNICIVKLYGEETYGEYVYIFALFSIITIIPLFGFERSLLHYIPLYKKEEKYLVDEVISFALYFVTLISTILIVIINVYSINISKILVGDASINNEIKFFSLFILVFSLYKLLVATLQSNNQMKQFAINLNITEPTFFLISLSIIWLTNYHSENNLILYSKYVSLLLSICMIVHILRKENLKFKNIFKTFFSKKEFLRFSYPLMFISALGILMSKLDVIMLASYVDSSKIASYNAAAQYALLGSFILTSINQVFSPKISRLVIDGEMNLLKILYAKVTRVLLIVSLCSLLFMIFFGKFMLSFYGENFVSAYNVLLLLFIGQMFSAICGPSGYLTVVLIHPKMDLLINLLSIILNVVINLILIPRVGIEGAAFGTMISFITTNVVKVLILFKRFKIIPFYYFEK